MKKVHTYITCQWCMNWDDDDRQARDACPQCKNTQKVISPVEQLCNMCGECMCPTIPGGGVNGEIPHGLYNAKVRGGYDSYHLLDMNQYTFSLCEKCLRQMFIQCKIKPDVKELLGGGSSPDTWEQDQKYYEYRVWRDEGGHRAAYLNGKCNSVKDCPVDAVYTILRGGDFTEDTTCEEHKDTRMCNWSKLTKFISNNLKAFL